MEESNIMEQLREQAEKYGNPEETINSLEELLEAIQHFESDVNIAINATHNDISKVDMIQIIIRIEEIKNLLYSEIENYQDKLK